MAFFLAAFALLVLAAPANAERYYQATVTIADVSASEGEDLTFTAKHTGDQVPGGVHGDPALYRRDGHRGRRLHPEQDPDDLLRHGRRGEDLYGVHQGG